MTKRRKVDPQTDDFKDSAIRPATRKAYAAHWLKFQAWAEHHPHAKHSLKQWPRRAFTSEDAADYAAQLATDGYSYATVCKHLAAINYQHEQQRLQSPTRDSLLTKVLKGIRKRLPHEVNQKRPLMHHHLEQIFEVFDGITGHPIRDKALVLLGWYLAARSSEVCEIERKNVTITPKGLIIRFEDTKTGPIQKAIPRNNGPLCPVAATERYLVTLADSRPFRLFPSPYRNKHGLNPINTRYYVELIKSLCEAIGLDSALYAGHSMRSGFVTQAAEDGAGLMATQVRTGHKSAATTARYYRGFEY